MHIGLSTDNKGFSVVELLITIVIITIITSLVLWNYEGFTSRSVLRTRTVDIVELLQLAQSHSASTFSSDNRKFVGDTEYLFGFVSVRIRVRDRKLHSYQLEESNLATDSSNGVFESYRKTFPPKQVLSDAKGNVQLKASTNSSTFELNEENQYEIRYCLLGDFKNEALKENIQSDLVTVCNRLKSPYDAVDIRTFFNELLYPTSQDSQPLDFDIHISFEHPTTEPYTAIIPLDPTCTKDEILGYEYSICYQTEQGKEKIIPSANPRIFSYSDDVISRIYGTRIFLIHDDSSFRYFDVLETGFIALRTPES